MHTWVPFRESNRSQFLASVALSSIFWISTLNAAISWFLSFRHPLSVFVYEKVLAFLPSVNPLPLHPSDSSQRLVLAASSIYVYITKADSTVHLLTQLVYYSLVFFFLTVHELPLLLVFWASNAQLTLDSQSTATFSKSLNVIFHIPGRHIRWSCQFHFLPQAGPWSPVSSSHTWGLLRGCPPLPFLAPFSGCLSSSCLVCSFIW